MTYFGRNLICKFEGCNRPVQYKNTNFCGAHYRQYKNGKHLTLVTPRRQIGSAPIIVFDEIPCLRKDLKGPCHIFVGYKSPKGYGQIRINGKTIGVHCYIWEKINGLIPNGFEIDHQCRNKSCCNIDHLRLVTHQINTLENIENHSWQINKAKTHCPQGHPYSGENLYTRRNGGRGCKECRKIVNEQYKIRKRGY